MALEQDICTVFVVDTKPFKSACTLTDLLITRFSAHGKDGDAGDRNGFCLVLSRNHRQ